METAIGLETIDQGVDISTSIIIYNNMASTNPEVLRALQYALRVGGNYHYLMMLIVGHADGVAINYQLPVPYLIDRFGVLINGFTLELTGLGVIPNLNFEIIAKMAMTPEYIQITKNIITIQNTLMDGGFLNGNISFDAYNTEFSDINKLGNLFNLHHENKRLLEIINKIAK